MISQDIIQHIVNGLIVGTAAGSAWGQLKAAKYNRLTHERDVKTQKNMRYDNLTRQYLDIKSNLPPNFKRLPLEDKLSEQHEEAARDMIGLFNKEHRSFVAEELEEDDWKEFLTGMANFGLSPQGGRIWQQVRNDPHCEIPERFIVFYNKFLDQERERRANGKINNGHSLTAIMKDKPQPMEDRA